MARGSPFLPLLLRTAVSRWCVAVFLSVDTSLTPRSRTWHVTDGRRALQSHWFSGTTVLGDCLSRKSAIIWYSKTFPSYSISTTSRFLYEVVLFVFLSREHSSSIPSPKKNSSSLSLSVFNAWKTMIIWISVCNCYCSMAYQLDIVNPPDSLVVDRKVNGDFPFERGLK